MACINLCNWFETRTSSNGEILNTFLDLKCAKHHGKNYIKARALPVGNLQTNCLLEGNWIQMEIYLVKKRPQHKQYVIKVKLI